MRETSFIRQNKEKWEEFEKQLNMDHRDPDNLSNILIQVTDDLSYSRTFYPNRSVRVYLNNLAQKIFSDIYKNKKDNRKKLIAFWKDDLPIMFYLCRKQLLISFLIFLLSVLIGALSTKFDKDFPKVILGEEYISMTLENIKKGDPMGVYKQQNQVDMFLGITLNNVLVAFRTFIVGIFFAIGTLIIMIYNGIMVGTFQYFFFQKGLFWDSFLTIWLHGTLEISSIIIAGAAGLVLGKGLVFPGTYSRLQAFQISAKQGLKLFIGIVPILVFAALIEGFVTRYTEVPSIVKASLIAASAAFVLFYFIYYPYLKSRGFDASKLVETRLNPSSKYMLDTSELKNNSKIFKDVFFVLKSKIKNLLLINLISGIAYTAAVSIVFFELFDNTTYWEFSEKVFLYFNYTDRPIIYLINSLFMASILGLVNITLKGLVEGKENIKNKWVPYLLATLFFTLLINLLFFLPIALGVMLFLILLPIFMLLVSINILDAQNPFKTFGRMFVLIKGNLSKMIGLHLILLMVGFIFLLVLSSPFIYLVVEALNMGSDISDKNLEYFSAGIFIFSFVTVVGFITTILSVGQALLYYSMVEMVEAKSLRKMIQKLANG